MAVVFINTELSGNRHRRLKSLKDIKNTDPDSEDVFIQLRSIGVHDRN